MGEGAKRVMTGFGMAIAVRLLERARRRCSTRSGTTVPLLARIPRNRERFQSRLPIGLGVARDLDCALAVSDRRGSPGFRWWCEEKAAMRAHKGSPQPGLGWLSKGARSAAAAARGDDGGALFPRARGNRGRSTIWPSVSNRRLAHPAGFGR